MLKCSPFSLCLFNSQLIYDREYRLFHIFLYTKWFQTISRQTKIAYSYKTEWCTVVEAFSEWKWTWNLNKKKTYPKMFKNMTKTKMWMKKMNVLCHKYTQTQSKKMARRKMMKLHFKSGVRQTLVPTVGF